MLILTRRVGETIIIGDNEIVISVLGIRGNQSRLGIDAPQNISVHREEVYKRIHNENKSDSEKDKDVNLKSD